MPNLGNLIKQIETLLPVPNENFPKLETSNFRLHLIQAIKLRNLHTALTLLSKKHTSLRQAQRIECFQLLVRSGLFDLDVVDANSNSVLHQACMAFPNLFD